jgi:microcin C transport system permease protein
MKEYFLRRLLLIIPTFLGITFLCFGITQFVPGGPVEQAIMRMRGGEQGGESVASTGQSEAGSITETQREYIRKHYGFDQPFLKRYWKWLVDDKIGLQMESYKFPNKTAWQMISERFPVSLVFGLTGFLLTYLVCIPLGVLKALWHGKPFDLVSSVIVFVGYAIPAFALGMVLKMVFCGTVDGLWDILPATGFHSQDFESPSPSDSSGDMLYGRKLCRIDLADEEFTAGADQQRLCPYGVCQGWKHRSGPVVPCVAQCVDSDCDRVRRRPIHHVCWFRDHRARF